MRPMGREKCNLNEPNRFTKIQLDAEASSAWREKKAVQQTALLFKNPFVAEKIRIFLYLICWRRNRKEKGLTHCRRLPPSAHARNIKRAFDRSSWCAMQFSVNLI